MRIIFAMMILAALMLNIPAANAQNLFVISNENTPGSEFDTLVMEDTGNTTLYGTFTLSDGASPYTLPNTDGTTRQILSTDGAGTVTWQSITEDHFSSSLVFDDGDVIDLSGIDASGSAEGLILPQGTDVSAATAEGQITWDSDNDTLYVGNGSGVEAVDTLGALNCQSGEIPEFDGTNWICASVEVTEVSSDLDMNSNNITNLSGIYNARTTQDPVAIQTETSTTYSTATKQWQSFIPSLSGELKSIEIYPSDRFVSSVIDIDGVIEIYEGEGTGGTLLASEAIVIPEGSSDFDNWYEVVFSAPPSIVAGTQYSYAITSVRLKIKDSA